MKVLAALLIALLININAYADDTVKVPILLYHNIIKEIGNENPLVNITPDNFRSHISALKKAGFEGITFEDYYDYVNEEKPLPDNPVIITFDDGYMSNYQYGYPVLKELGMKATIFVVTGTTGAVMETSYPHFTWSEAREMEQSGVISIQSHSHLHRDIATLEPNDIVREIRLSKYLIETNLNKECFVLAYPYGSFNDFARQTAAAAGYKIQCRVGDSGYNTKDTEILKRITVRGHWSSNELIEIINQNLQDGLE